MKRGSVVRLVLWAVISAMLLAVFLREFWINLPGMLSPVRVLEQNQAAPWGVLALCLGSLWLKRKQVGDKMSRSPAPVFIPVGLALVAGALLMPYSPDYQVFRVLLVVLGVFVIFFGKAARVPSVLLGIYGFAVSFPLLVERFAEDAYSRTAVVPLTGLLGVLRYPFESYGQWLHFGSLTGEPISVVITTACAGPATMGVFLAIFTLMMLDMPVPPSKAMGLLLFGVIGTWLQSFIRLVVLIMLGYYLGESALWAAHSWTIYILFPLWYLFFAYIYFRQYERLPDAGGKPVLAVEYS
ncbi:MAG: exosortase/archaeosortase family protein [Dehalococcoidales bacterium]|nr:exosortase/archaeosortase family protein [Dehalococcoidales bacterium]MDZ4230243.1 exosortase/archaeosortase family protein [Dehalococcoidales bacterium]